jgi:hypothetical protein
MIQITKIENDFINQYTIATVNIYEITLGVQRLKDTFIITLTGIYDISDPQLLDLIYARLHNIGYEIILQSSTAATTTAGSLDTEIQNIIDQAAAEATAQELLNAVEREFLRSTDWQILRHIRQKSLNQTTSLTEDQYLTLEQQRADAAGVEVRYLTPDATTKLLESDTASWAKAIKAANIKFD